MTVGLLQATAYRLMMSIVINGLLVAAIAQENENTRPAFCSISLNKTF